MYKYIYVIQNNQDSVCIIDRETKKPEMFYLGHKKSVLACNYNPVLFKDSTNKIITYCAIGGIDKTVSIWSIDKNKPVIAITDIVEEKITDLCWAENGFNLYISSASGDVVVLNFTEKELGTPLDPKDKEAYITKHYGSVDNGGVLLDIPESFDIMKLQEKAKVFKIIFRKMMMMINYNKQKNQL